MTELETRDLLAQALADSRADATTAALAGVQEASTRFANNAITQNVAKTNVTLTVRAAFGNRVGVSQTNSLSPESVADAVRRSEGIARHAAPDTEYMPPVRPCSCGRVEAWDQAVADASPETRARAIKEAIAVVEQSGLTAAGSYATESGFSAILNSCGHFAYHRETDARFVCTAMSPDSSGWASDGAFRLQDVAHLDAARRAAQKAVAGRTPEPIEAEPSTVILEPAATAELLEFVAWSLDAKAADEGRSAFSGRLGHRIAVPGVAITSDPMHDQCPATPFDADGTPLPKVEWVADGVLANLSSSRFWAQKTGRPYTGRPTNLLMAGTDRGLAKMIEDTPSGILVTRFWYIRFVDPMKLLLTGMTRDGLFRIRDGRVAGGLKNMRFNESPLRMFERITGIGQAQVVAGYGRGMAPPLRVDGFTFSSGTAF